MIFRTVLRKLVPVAVRQALLEKYASARNIVLDMCDASERRREMIPPRSITFIGDGDYKAIGMEFKNLFITYGGLKADDRILDVGCGLGRMAVPLTDFVCKPGRYQGFDVVKSAVVWAEKNIATRFPLFSFHHANVINKHYNPDGEYEASAYRFEFPDDTLDFIFLTSVFTHMFPRDLEHYLAEISRVLKPGKTCFITFFLLNEEANRLIQLGKSSQKFLYELDGCVTTSPENPEIALAFPERYIEDLFAKNGLSIVGPTHYGSWCGRPQYLSYQDIIVASKI
jgi:ubiquinone/menaquinone biosynthesis C-methylase UbiE